MEHLKLGLTSFYLGISNLASFIIFMMIAVMTNGNLDNDSISLVLGSSICCMSFFTIPIGLGLGVAAVVRINNFEKWQGWAGLSINAGLMLIYTVCYIIGKIGN
jgi:hypothetical protein